MVDVSRAEALKFLEAASNQQPVILSAEFIADLRKSLAQDDERDLTYNLQAMDIVDQVLPLLLEAEATDRYLRCHEMLGRDSTNEYVALPKTLEAFGGHCFRLLESRGYPVQTVIWHTGRGIKVLGYRLTPPSDSDKFVDVATLQHR